MTRTLVVTNDFPPRRGGIQTFVQALCDGLPPDEVVVHASSFPGDRTFDAGLRYPVVRERTRVLLPTPRVARRSAQLLRSSGCDRVLYGASAPLGLLGPALRAAGARRQVALTHGHEVWWAEVPGTRALLRRVGEGTDVLTYVSEWTRERIAPALSPAAADRMVRLSPGVDAERFRPGAGGAALRARLGIAADRPVVVCVGRVVPRKGQDTLVRAMRTVLAEVPHALLLIVGDGPHRSDVEALAREVGVADSVRFTGALVEEDLPAAYDAGDVFAMPCRARRAGLEVEAWGIVFLEAQACGVPVVVGDSGGAPESCVHGETGYVVDPLNPVAVAAKLLVLLRDAELRVRMGAAARVWAQRWTWTAAVRRLAELLEPSDSARRTG